MAEEGATIKTNTWFRSRHGLGCLGMPRLGSGTLHHFPTYAPGHDPDRRIWLLCVSVPIATMSIGRCLHGTSGLNVTALIMIFLWVPETKQRTLEELDYVFAVPTSVHMRYQVCKVIPWWVKSRVLRRNAVLEPLYQFDSAADDDAAVELVENIAVHTLA